MIILLIIVLINIININMINQEINKNYKYTTIFGGILYFYNFYGILKYDHIY